MDTQYALYKYFIPVKINLIVQMQKQNLGQWVSFYYVFHKNVLIFFKVESKNIQ